MVYRALADVVVMIHGAFIGYVVVGGFVAWRWPRTIFLHVLAAGWGLVVVSLHLTCPLTVLENMFRRLGGEDVLGRAGFIDHYVKGVIYPERYTGVMQALVAACVLGSWAGLWLRRRGAHPSVRSHTP